MNNADAILLYVGTIFIGYEYLLEFYYLGSLLLAPFFKRLLKAYSDFMRDTLSSKERFVKALKIVILFVLLSPLCAIALICILVTMFIGWPLRNINRGLNYLLVKLLEPGKEIYFEAMRMAVRDKKTTVPPTDKNLWKIVQDKQVPFIPLFGVLMVTLGFILQMIN